jgi:cell wall assembly regulator SMI1
MSDTARATMEATWQRLEKWIALHLPDLQTSLVVPASDAEIKAAEEELNLTLPDDFKASLKVHDGQSESAETGLWFGFVPLPLDKILLEWRQWQEIADEIGDEMQNSERNTSAPAGCIKCQYVNAKWIPLCHDYGGNFIGIDLDPGPKGVVGQIINFGADEDDKFIIAQSYGAFLQNIADQLDADNFRLDEEGLNLKHPPVSHFIDGLRSQFNARQK